MKNILRNGIFIGISGIMSLSLMTSCNEEVKKSTQVIKVEDMDLSTKPGHDFNQYANGGWKKNHPIPEDRSRYGSFDQLAENGEKQVKELILETAKQENPAGSVAQKIGDFYASGMDSVKIQEMGIKPILGEMQKIEALKSRSQVMKKIAEMHSFGITPLFGLYCGADSKNSSMVIAHMYQDGLGMPNRDYYTDKTDRSKEIRTAYLIHLEKMFVLLGDKPATAKANAQTVMALETQLAKASMTMLEQRDPHKTYNKMSEKELAKLVPSVNWTNYFADLGLDQPGEVIVGQPDFFKTVNSMLKSVPVKDWITYLRWNYINSNAAYLSDDFVNQNFDFYGKTLSGSKVMRPRWKRALQMTNGSLSEAIGELYVAKYFPPEAKIRMEKLINNLKVALGERIENVSWMSPETKEKGIEKLKAINVKVGYPDNWRDYSALEISRDSYVQNIMNARQFAVQYNLNKNNKPVDKAEWHMPPQMVNAYYSPTMNEVVFPAAILQPPFFYMDGDDAVNYGAIGVVIGHEMTHGFDDKGRLFDKEGNLNTWWTEKDAELFTERAQVLVDRFNSFIVLDSVHADGQLTLGENIADLGGLNISYTAFKKTEQFKNQEKIDDFTPEQRFFLAYSHVWAQNIRDKEILNRTKQDVHSLGVYRVNGPLPNMPEFLNAFDIKEGDPMFLAEEERAIIW